MLAANRVERATGVRASHPSLLTGMVFDEAGERLTPTYAVKKGTRYRYYVSTSLLTGAGRNRSSGRRIPAGNLEGLVINKIRAFLADPGAILDAVNNESHNGSGLGCSAGEKSQPRNGPGEIFITAAAEIARETVSATNRFEHETGNPRKFARK